MSMFGMAKARVYLDGRLGEPINSICGVLQGGILSPKFLMSLCLISQIT